MQHVEVTQRVAAPREAVFDVLADLPRWTRWAGLGRVTLEREGRDTPCGPGAIRVFTNYGFAGREEILSLERPATMTYTLLSGMPVRDHLAEVHCTEDGDGTLVTWRCRFEATVPGLGPVLQLFVRWIFTRTLRRLARRVEGMAPS
jgi:uncharacterized protein YndB with AHSA1/START domain